MLFAAETWPFTAATFLMLLIAIVEGVAMVVGATLSEVLQHHLPDPWDSGLDGLVKVAPAAAPANVPAVQK